MFTRDLLERAIKTFLQTFIATFTATFIIPSDFTVEGFKRAGLAAAVAAGASALSAVSSLLSKNTGIPGTASLLKPADPSCQ